mmetsp:Transcript_106751/g.309680  ORF Transcript_106751/g.309680 Transcript_106751/m.309680 type:complete len:206 (-) Transcript_106751:257-874(-)
MTFFFFNAGARRDFFNAHGEMAPGRGQIPRWRGIREPGVPLACAEHACGYAHMNEAACALFDSVHHINKRALRPSPQWRHPRLEASRLANAEATASTVECTFPFGMFGNTDASATYRFSMPCTLRLPSTADVARSFPILALQHQCELEVCFSSTHFFTSSCDCIWIPGSSSPMTNVFKGSDEKISRTIATPRTSLSASKSSRWSW